jgi:biotin carboxyl carrier protein
VIPIPACSVVTTPVDGRLHRVAPIGRRVRKGDVVATVESTRGSRELVAVAAGEVGGSLVDLSQGVAAGDPVVWLSRA